MGRWEDEGVQGRMVRVGGGIVLFTGLDQKKCRCQGISISDVR